MRRSLATLMTALVASGGLCACSSDGGLFGTSLTTSSVGSAQATAPVAPIPKIDPACASLAARIDALRRDGVADRVEKASVGKTTSVSVKRTSLAQMAELDKANAEFQAKCSTLGPQISVQAQAAPATATSAVVSTRTTAAVVPPVVSTQAAKPQQ